MDDGVDFHEWLDTQRPTVTSEPPRPLDVKAAPRPPEPERPNSLRFLRPSCRPGSFGDPL